VRYIYIAILDVTFDAVGRHSKLFHRWRHSYYAENKRTFRMNEMPNPMSQLGASPKTDELTCHLLAQLKLITVD
jgi:hypothetical protein